MWPQEEQSRAIERPDPDEKEVRRAGRRLCRRAWHERNEFAVQSRLADEQTGGNGNAHPAVLQNIHRETCAAGGEIAVDAQIVVHTRERGFDRWGLRIALDGYARACSVRYSSTGKTTHPGECAAGLLREIRRKKEQNGYKVTEEQRQSWTFP